MNTLLPVVVVPLIAPSSVAIASNPLHPLVQTLHPAWSNRDPLEIPPPVMFRRGHRYNVVHSLATRSPHAKNSPRPQLSRSIRRSQLCFTLVMPSPADLRRLKSASFGTGDRDTGSSMLATLVVRNNIITRCGFGAPALGQQRSGLRSRLGYDDRRGGRNGMYRHKLSAATKWLPSYAQSTKSLSRHVTLIHLSFGCAIDTSRSICSARWSVRWSATWSALLPCWEAAVTAPHASGLNREAQAGAHHIPLVGFKTAKDASCNGYRKDRPQNRYFILPSLLGGTVRLAGCAA